MWSLINKSSALPQSTRSVRCRFGKDDRQSPSLCPPGSVTKHCRWVLLPGFGQVLSPGFVCFSWAAGRFSSEPLIRRCSFRIIFTSRVTKCSIAVGQDLYGILDLRMILIRYQAKGWLVIWLGLALRPHDVCFDWTPLTGYLDARLVECFNYFISFFNRR